MPDIHPTAIVDSNAKIADNVKIGPYCIVGPNVTIGDGCELIAQCCITGNTVLGKNNKVFQNATLGGAPQDFEFDNIVSYLKIGDRNIFREGVTVNVGTKEDSETVIGNDCYLMINSHVAHNCKIADKVVLVNNVLLGGYVEIEESVIMGGAAGVHQFCRVGRLALASGNSGISKDLPPFMIATERNKVSSLNLVGLRRNGFSKEAIKAIKDIYKIFYMSNKSIGPALEKIKKDLPQLPEVIEFIEFVKSTKKGVLSSAEYVSKR